MLLPFDYLFAKLWWFQRHREFGPFHVKENGVNFVLEEGHDVRDYVVVVYQVIPLIVFQLQTFQNALLCPRETTV